MIPDKSVVPSGEAEVKVPSLEVLLTCVNESKIKIVLESKAKWKETLVTRNFVVVSPMITSSIASLDRSALALNILSEVIKTIRDLNLSTTNKFGKLAEPITKLIAFLIMRAVDDMEDDHEKRITVPTTFDKASNIEMNEYKLQINKLIQQNSLSNNSNVNENKTENHTKKRKRSQASKIDKDEDDDNHNQRGEGNDLHQSHHCKTRRTSCF